MSERPVDEAGGGWKITANAFHAAVVGVVIVAVALVLSRPDVAVLGIPLILSLVWSAARPPQGPVRLRLGRPGAVPDSPDVAATLSVSPVANVPSVRIRVSAEAHHPIEALIDSRRPRELDASLTTARTGRRRMFLVDYAGVGSDTVYRSEPSHVGPESIVLLPQAGGLREIPLPFQLHGLTGAHVSRRVGDGGDLRDIAVFQPGDRLRRIDWKTTAKRGLVGGVGTDLYVRRTHATADAHVMLVLDARDNVGPDVATWSTGEVNPMDMTSLDIARRAAATLARHYLGQGDRVGLVDIGRNRRPLLPAGGRRHLHRIIHHLATTEPDTEPRRYVRAPQIPSGVLVVVFSTFLDDSYAEMARLWRHDGHRVLAVDALPRLVTKRLTPHAHMALRVMWMERLDRIDDMRQSGVEVIRWMEDPELGADPMASLATLARTGRRPR